MILRIRVSCGCGLDWSRIEAFQGKKYNSNDLLEDFRLFCLVDKRLRESTTYRHCRNIERILKTIGKNPHAITRNNLRLYLTQYLHKSTSTYANQIKSMRVFFRDFLNQGDLVKSFRLPQQEFKPRILPSIEELREFYHDLESTRDKLLFLLYATSGLRKTEILSLRLKDIDLNNNMIIPNNHNGSRTKRSYVSFFNEEARELLLEYIKEYSITDKLFTIKNSDCFRHGSKITPQVLRFWFSNQLALKGVPDRYIDSMQGRQPRSILSKFYTDYSPSILKQFYDSANLLVLS
jgi:integrase